MWFIEAQNRYKQLQEKNTKTLDDKEKSERQAVLDELQTEISLLDALRDKPLQVIIDFLFDNFPPKHRKKATKPKIIDGRQKDTLITLSALYHPDKINEKEHGLKYKVLCLEIVMRINQRLARCKL